MSLTLEQVKKAGRFAWSHAGGYRDVPVFVPGYGTAVLFATYNYSGIWGGRSFDASGEVYDDSGAGHSDSGGEVPEDGWHHLPGCDCEFCR